MVPERPAGPAPDFRDGRTILAQVIEAGEQGYVFDLASGQYLLEFVMDYLYDALE